MGWTAHGDRPEFDLVTGISAGALIAPFAFLGRDYDKQLAGLFTTYGADQIYQANVLSGLFGGSSLADSAPLAQLIERYVDDRFLRRVAEERSKGRFLLIGTTNLDAQRPSIGTWAGSPRATIRRHPTFSAGCCWRPPPSPGIFPPVHIAVVAGGGPTRRCTSTAAPARGVLHPRRLLLPRSDKAIGRKVQRRLWVVRNGKVAPEYKVTREHDLRHRRAFARDADQEPEAGRPDAHVRQGEGRQHRLQSGGDPRRFEAPRPKPFDRGYMHALDEVG